MCFMGLPGGTAINNMTFGQWIKSERERRGLTQRALAARAEVSAGMVGRLETGSVGYSQAMVIQIAEALAGPDATDDDIESLRREALAASVGLGQEIVRHPTDDAEFWDAYEGAPQEDRELAKQLLMRARDRERARTIGGKVAE